MIECLVGTEIIKLPCWTVHIFSIIGFITFMCFIMVICWSLVLFIMGFVNTYNEIKEFLKKRKGK